MKRAFPIALLAYGLVNLALFGLFKANHLSNDKVLTDKAIRSSNYETRKEGPWIWWNTRSYMSRAINPDVVILGSSQMGSAIFSAEAEHRGKAVDTLDEREVSRLSEDVAAISDKHPSVFNLSMGGAMVSDHYLMAKALFHGQQKPKVVIIGVNPRDFLDNTLPSASSTDTFYFLSPYVDLGKLAALSFDNPFGLLDYKLKQYLPLKQITSILKGNEPPSLANVSTFTNPEAKGLDTKNSTGDGKPVGTKVLAAISGSAGDVRKGVWLIPPAPPRLFMDNTREYLRRYKSPKAACLAGQKAYFEALLGYLHQEHIQALVIGMPSLKVNRDILPQSFWQDFRSYLASSAQNNGAVYLDLFEDARFKPEHFLDTVHLNRWGGGELVSIISQALVTDNKLAQALPASSNQIAGKKAVEKQWH